MGNITPETPLLAAIILGSTVALREQWGVRMAS
jgi:hypothetical protein